MGFIILAIILLAIVMFFAPVIIIWQLSEIKDLLRQIGTHMDDNHDHLIESMCGTANNDEEAKQHENKKNTSDQ